MISVKYKPRAVGVPAADPEVAYAHFSAKLAFETDPSDVYADITNGVDNFVLADVRGVEDYERSHAKGAISLPHRTITESRMAEFDQNTMFVVYCWGPGCNGAIKAAAKLSALGFRVKEMIGGIEYWENKERYPVVGSGSGA